VVAVVLGEVVVGAVVELVATLPTGTECLVW